LLWRDDGNVQRGLGRRLGWFGAREGHLQRDNGRVQRGLGRRRWSGSGSRDCFLGPDSQRTNPGERTPGSRFRSEPAGKQRFRTGADGQAAATTAGARSPGRRRGHGGGGKRPCTHGATFRGDQPYRAGSIRHQTGRAAQARPIASDRGRARMSYDNSANAVRRLEERFERLLLLLGDMQAAIGRVQQPSYNAAGGQPGGGGGVTYMVMAPTAAITAGLSTPLTGQTVVVISGAATVT